MVLAPRSLTGAGPRRARRDATGARPAPAAPPVVTPRGAITQPGRPGGDHADALVGRLKNQPSPPNSRGADYLGQSFNGRRLLASLIHRGRWAFLALVSCAHTLGAVSVLAVAPLSPLLLDDLGLSRAQFGVSCPRSISAASRCRCQGWLTDRLGARLTLVGGQCLTALMVGLAAWSPGLATMLPLYCLAGLGWAVIDPSRARRSSIGSRRASAAWRWA